MDFAATLAQVNITLGDTGNVTFTVEEKTRALTKAWNDPYVVETRWNTAGSFSTSNYQTPIPSGVSVVLDIGVKSSTSDFPVPVASNYWDVVGSNIQWTNDARWGLTNASTLYIKAKFKLTTSDTITTTALQEYVISLGAYNTLSLLGFKKANLFLKNDLTMNELVTMKREFDRDIKEMRHRFAKEFQPI